MTTVNQIQQLLTLQTQLYTLHNNPHPEIAAQYAVTDLLNMYKGQPQYLEQLLNEEIEDTQKRINQLTSKL